MSTEQRFMCCEHCVTDNPDAYDTRWHAKYGRDWHDGPCNWGGKHCPEGDRRVEGGAS